jgi:hypothetical protein
MSTNHRHILSAATALLALVEGWCAVSLPWTPSAPLAALLACLALLNAATAACAAFKPTWTARVLKALARASLASALAFATAIAITCAELVAGYGALGWGLTALLALILLLAMAATIPIGVWGLWRRPR